MVRKPTHNRQVRRVHIAAVLLALSVNPAWANGGYFPDLTSPLGITMIAVNELFVVIVEGFAFRGIFKISSLAAYRTSLCANALSFAVGLLIQLLLPDDSGRGYNVTAFPYWATFALPVNIVTEGLVWSFGRSGYRFLLQLIPVNLLTWIVGFIVFTTYPQAATRAKSSRVRNDIRSMATSLEAYFVDHDAYPRMIPFIELAPQYRQELEQMNGEKLNTVFPGTGIEAGVTTPISYITSLFPDPFAPARLSFAYHTAGSSWIMFSPGTDKLYDIVPEEDFDSTTTKPALIAKTWDPTNGMVSGGDIWTAGHGLVPYPAGPKSHKGFHEVRNDWTQ
jgi:hypothetical protein